MKYPDELPAFEFHGRDYEARQEFMGGDEYGPDIVLVDNMMYGEGIVAFVNNRNGNTERVKPLTPAAEAMLAIAKAGAR